MHVLLLYSFKQCQFGEYKRVSSISTCHGATSTKRSEQNQHKHSAANYVISIHENFILVADEQNKQWIGSMTHKRGGDIFTILKIKMTNVSNCQ